MHIQLPPIYIKPKQCGLSSPQTADWFFWHYLIRKCTNVLCSAIFISPCWSQLSEAPTLGWCDESLMASGFHIGAMFLPCALYPCLYYMYVYIMWLHHSLSLSLSVSSQYLFVLGIWYSYLLPCSKLIILQSSRYRYRFPSEIFTNKNLIVSCMSCCSKHNLLYSTL